MASPLYTSSSRKHKKHKSDKRERLESPSSGGLKLILKVGSQATPEHTTDFSYSNNNNSLTSTLSSSTTTTTTTTATTTSLSSSSSSSTIITTTSSSITTTIISGITSTTTSPATTTATAAASTANLTTSTPASSSSTAYSIHNDDVINQLDPNSSDYYGIVRSHHKKSKKKKKKKDKKERKHRHHHKEKKRKRDEYEDDENYEIGSPSQHREPRTCVLKKIKERTAVQKMCDQLLGLLEKKDPQQFFAWPVTDSIAPGYSSIITQPMDFSTMRQKIEDNHYGNLQDFIVDFKLMCTNAMKYNHVDTIYYKASKKLLHAGMKIMQPEKLGWILNLLPELTSDDMGFEITPEIRQNRNLISGVTGIISGNVVSGNSSGNGICSGGTGSGTGSQDDHDDSDHPIENTININNHNLNHTINTYSISNKRKMPITKFEAIIDDLTPEEILAKSQIAAREAKVRLMHKRGGSAPMGFLKQRKDGTTNLSILVGGDGIIPGTKKRPVLLGQLCGKLGEGSGQLHGYREDRRNITKPIKPLYYGAFGSYAPSYDSAFSNLNKEESDLVLQTYGSDTAVQYAESVLDFVKDNDYATHLVDSLLDLLTGGDHSKTKKILDDNKKLREEEEAIKAVLEVKPVDSIKINMNELKSLQDLGIDVNFLDQMEDEIRLSEERHELQQRLDSMCQLLEKLQQTQQQRLSQQLPIHLSQCQPPNDDEIQIADNITENLTEIVKSVQPNDVAPIGSLRKALGVVLPPQKTPTITTATTTSTSSSSSVTTTTSTTKIPSTSASIVTTSLTSTTTNTTTTTTTTTSTTSSDNVDNEIIPDLESELRQFLESDSALNHSPLRDDKTIEEILME